MRRSLVLGVGLALVALVVAGVGIVWWNVEGRWSDRPVVDLTSGDRLEVRP